MSAVSLGIPHDGGRRPCLPKGPSARGFIGLLESFRASGGTVPGSILDRLLDERCGNPPQALAALLASGQVFGFDWRDSAWIPMFQFDAKSLSLRLAPQSVRAALPPVWSDWLLAVWFATPLASLGGRCPADHLETDPAAVLRAAQAVARVTLVKPRSAPREREFAVQI